MTASERNEHYGRLNDRFDGRAARLRKMGFVYEHVTGVDYDLGVFVRRRPGFRKADVIAAAFVMNADEVVWTDQVRRVRDLQTGHHN
jgi:hypothetical protein